MTESPADLIAVQVYVHARTGQPWDALGIKHATPQGGGYHEGNDLLAAAGRLSSDYSKRESARDRPGTNSASAFDLGGDFPRFREITLALVAACQRGDPRTRDVREVIYTPDGKTVRRWDRLGLRSTGDSSHLSHTHISFFRDSEGRRDRADNFLGLLRELFEGQEADMTPDQERRLQSAEAHAWAVRTGERPSTFINGGTAQANNGNPLWDTLEALAAKVDTLAAPAAPVVDVDQLAQKVAALILPAVVAANSAAVADELAKRLGNG